MTNDFKDTPLTQEIVRELLDYNPDTGALTWKSRDRKWFTSDHACQSWNTRYAGKSAFKAIDGDGYKHGAIFNKKYTAHRIIWLWMTGEWPDPEVDHENHNRTDNCWKNLSEKDDNGQTRNHSLNCNNTSGQVGVCKIPDGRWKMQITDNEGRRHWYFFKTFDEAVAARKEAEIKYGYHKNHGALRNDAGKKKVEGNEMTLTDKQRKTYNANRRDKRRKARLLAGGRLRRFSDEEKKIRKAFQQAKYHAQNRGVEFLLDFPTWEKIWTDSGHFLDMGNRKGQAFMARLNKKVGFVVGNVQIKVRNEIPVSKRPYCRRSPEHGHINCYNGGCRCEECKRANREYHRRHRAQKRQQEQNDDAVMKAA